MKVRIGNDICLKFSISTQQKKIFLRTVDASFIPSEYSFNITGTDEYFDVDNKMFYVDRVQVDKSAMEYSASGEAPTEFHFVKVTKNESTTPATITQVGDIVVGTLKDVSDASLTSDLIVWADVDVQRDFINIYEIKESPGVAASESAAVKGVRAYFVNRTMKKKIEDDLKKKTRFVSRFPVEPCCCAYSSTKYNINSGGYPNWNAYPCQRCAAPYTGFGCCPDWKYIYPGPETCVAEYQAEVRALPLSNEYETIFPAVAQLFTGDYDLIIVADLYAQNYGRNNTRTVTIDKEEVFTLVDSTKEGVDGDVVIDVRTNDIYPQPVTDVHLESGVLDTSDNDIVLTLNDGQTVNVSVDNITHWIDV